MTVSLSRDTRAAKPRRRSCGPDGAARSSGSWRAGGRSRILKSMASDALPLVTHWIDGKPTEGASARTGEVFDPATGRLTKRVAFASPADVDAAVTAASA